VQVVVTLAGGYEYVYARDLVSKTDSDSYTWEESYVIVGSGSAQSPLLLVKKQPEIAGVGIVCTGGADARVQNELTALVSAAFGIGTNKIHVSGAQNE
jgi:stage III sporulation protein AG